MFSGVVGKLDQFSRYAGAQNARENRAARDGFGGIGVRISVEDDEVRVISVMHYTPAERMGLKNDDVITEIDGQTTKGLQPAAGGGQAARPGRQHGRHHDPARRRVRSRSSFRSPAPTWCRKPWTTGAKAMSAISASTASTPRPPKA